MTSETQTTKEKIKWTSWKLKNFCTAKNTIKKVKTQLIEWQKSFANSITDTRCISRIYKEVLQFTTKMSYNPRFKWAKILNRHLSKENIQMANKKMKRWSTELVIRKCKSKLLQGTSLVAQWLRICLPMQGTQVRALVREDSTCRRATKPVCHDQWTCALEPASHNYSTHVPQLLKPARLEPMLCNKRSHCNEKPVHHKEE